MNKWGEKDSNLRSSRNGFTVRPIWPLWNLPKMFRHCKNYANDFQNTYTKSHLPESNQRPTDYKSVALPAELKWLIELEIDLKPDFNAKPFQINLLQVYLVLFFVKKELKSHENCTCLL